MDAQWMSTGEVAEILGVSRQHIVDLCERGELPFAKVGTHRRIRRADLNGLFRTHLDEGQLRSLWLHRAVLGELVANPDDVIATARDNVRRWRRVHRADGMSAHYLDQWDRVLDGDIDDIARVLVGTDELSTELRQNSPFAGVLSPARRNQVLAAFRAHGLPRRQEAS